MEGAENSGMLFVTAAVCNRPTLEPGDPTMAAVAGMAAMELGGCEGLCICIWVPTCSKKVVSCSFYTIT